MKQKEFLANYHLEQRDFVLGRTADLKRQGLVEGYKDVYPDVYKRIHKNKGVAYIRGNVSLKLMALIYDVTIIFIPPITKRQIEHRFDISYDDLLELCRYNIVIPIIGNVANYTAPHFTELFNLPNPPSSLWARGLALLDVFDMGNRLEIARESLPIADMIECKDVFKSYQSRALSVPILAGTGKIKLQKRIEDDIALMYANLCIFGCEKDAVALSSLIPAEIYSQLRIMNEVLVYPTLFGLDSQPNYNLDKLKDVSKVPLNQDTFNPVYAPQKELAILFGGIGIDVESVSVADIVECHGDEIGKQLRGALISFNEYCYSQLRHDASVDEVTIYNKAEFFQEKLKEVVREFQVVQYAQMDKRVDRLTNTFQIGSVAIGALVPILEPTLAPISIFGAGGTLMLSLPSKLANFITKLEAEGRQSKFLANMWTAKRIIDGKK